MKNKNQLEAMQRRDYVKYHNFIEEVNLLIGAVSSIQGAKSNLNSLTQLEGELLLSLRRLKKIVKSSAGERYQDRLKVFEKTILELLEPVRLEYIHQFNRKNSLSLDAAKIFLRMKGRERSLRIHNVIFWELTSHIIPEHPKDEYIFARSLKRKFVIHSGGTNTGKTFNALEAMKTSKKGIYLGPLRLLALEVYHKLNEEGTPCSLSTGEEDVIVEGANHMSSTVEKLNTDERYDLMVIDEAQMVSDRQRGHAFTTAILGAYADEVHICCSPNAVDIICKLIKDCGDSYEVKEYVRDTELKVEMNKEFIFPKDVTKGDALIAFSKRKVMAIASLLREEGISASLIYGDLPPEARRRQVQLFLNGETDVVVATDAIGMGLNLPIRRIVFMEIEKFDGVKERLLNSSEVKQISGRAGRKNIYNIGYVNSIENKKYIHDALDMKLPELKSAYYLPAQQYILSFPVGTLEERLFACMEARKDIEGFARSNIDEQLSLLGSISKLRKMNRDVRKLSMEEEYRLAFIPFDSDEERLREQWEGYVELYAAGRELYYPVNASDRLSELELHYKALNLYYSFSKTMKLRFDAEDILEQKDEISKKIHSILMKDIQVYGRTCRLCGKELPYNHKHNICDRCYVMGSYYHNSSW